ncbi:hypothetical protein EDE11_1238 [Methylomonas methanica]|uniref:Uncharacterized protein n=1 Tax=Methylomonas methanica TaxID=421 RepID=A0ABY2CIB5_METMH|nr:hypothetical protein EDE11_1238 [Methylomonas methanica]
MNCRMAKLLRKLYDHTAESLLMKNWRSAGIRCRKYRVHVSGFGFGINSSDADYQTRERQSKASGHQSKSA